MQQVNEYFKCFYLFLVTWYTATKQVVFGKDVILTCYTGHALLNSKDCPVRQWSGGPDHNGLMYNGYSSNEEKYEEEANLSTNQFSLKIKTFSESDVNVNYTCSCGFSTFTQKLILNNTHYHCKFSFIKRYLISRLVYELLDDSLFAIIVTVSKSHF